MYVLIIPTILLFVCFLALPSINFQFKQLFFIPVNILLSDKTFSWDLGRKSDYCGSGINQLGGNSAGD